MNERGSEVKTPSAEVAVLLEKIRVLYRQRELVFQANDRMSSTVQKFEKKIRDFLRGFGIDESLFSFEVEDLEGLIDGLLVMIRSQRHDIECRQRAQNRADGIIEYIQSESGDLEKDRGELTKRIMMLELEVETLKQGNKKDARKRR